jgi:hypothetical protein
MTRAASPGRYSASARRLGQHKFGAVDIAYVLVDVESDGPIPGDYSMICFGAVVVREGLEEAFYGRLKPISDKWVP